MNEEGMEQSIGDEAQAFLNRRSAVLSQEPLAKVEITSQKDALIGRFLEAFREIPQVREAAFNKVFDTSRLRRGDSDILVALGSLLIKIDNFEDDGARGMAIRVKTLTDQEDMEEELEESRSSLYKWEEIGEMGRRLQDGFRYMGPDQIGADGWGRWLENTPAAKEGIESILRRLEPFRRPEMQ